MYKYKIYIILTFKFNHGNIFRFIIYINNNISFKNQLLNTGVQGGFSMGIF